MVDGGRPLEVLDQILAQYQVVQHGVAMYFGSADGPNREHLRHLKTLTRRTKTPWLSDHLCWGSVDGSFSHDLLPMPYTFAAAKRTAENIRQVRDYLEIPIAVENVSSYTKFEKYILDTHDHPVLDPVWKLYAHATKLCGVTATLLEWDDKIPSFDEVHNEALKAHEFIDQAREAKIPAPRETIRTRAR